MTCKNFDDNLNNDIMNTFAFSTEILSIFSFIISTVAFIIFLKQKLKISGAFPVLNSVSFIFLMAGSLIYLLSGIPTVIPASVIAAVILQICGVLTLRPAEAAPQVETENIQDDILSETDSVEEEESNLLKIGQDFISYVSESMTGGVNLERLLDFTNQTLIQNTKADGGVIFLIDDFDDILNAKSFSGQFPPPYKLPADLPHKPIRVETSFRYSQFPFTGNIFGETAVSAEPVFIEDGANDPRVYVNGPEEFLKPGSYIIAPLSIKGKVVGISGLARLPQNKPFTEKDFTTAKTLANYAGAAINNVYCIQEVLEQADLEREAEIAAGIQKTLQPKRLPDLPEVGFGNFFSPAKGICGDYYDIILARRDRIALIMADVAGKGILSSMVMMMLRSILHLVTNTTKSASVILDWVNKGITGKINVDHYAALSYVSYSPQTHEINYSNAGRQPMLLWKSAENKVEKFLLNSDPIGVERNSTYEEIKLTVAPGDIIILFTDGLVETLNAEGKQYGIANLSKVISENSGKAAGDIAAAVKQDLKVFLGAAAVHDDQTLLVMKIKN